MFTCLPSKVRLTPHCSHVSNQQQCAALCRFRDSRVQVLPSSCCAANVTTCYYQSRRKQHTWHLLDGYVGSCMAPQHVQQFLSCSLELEQVPWWVVAKYMPTQRGSLRLIEGRPQVHAVPCKSIEGQVLLLRFMSSMMPIMGPDIHTPCRQTA